MEAPHDSFLLSFTEGPYVKDYRGLRCIKLLRQSSGSYPVRSADEVGSRFQDLHAAFQKAHDVIIADAAQPQRDLVLSSRLGD